MIEFGNARRVIACAVSIGLLTLSACSAAPTAGTETDSGSSGDVSDVAAGEASTGSLTVFEASFVHEISIEFDTVDIDGVTYHSAGVRLKGNSSLRGLTGGAGGPSGEVSADDPSGLPWLIKLDKYVDGENHGGVIDFVVRSNNSATAMNEALALDLLDAAGLASQDAMAVRFSINGGAEVLRLVIEHPDDVWMAQVFDAGGALYKAESTGDYSYRGDDPEAYDEVFDQEAGKDNADLTPLIEFLDFINNSDDITFEAEIGD